MKKNTKIALLAAKTLGKQVAIGFLFASAVYGLVWVIVWMGTAPQNEVDAVMGWVFGILFSIVLLVWVALLVWSAIDDAKRKVEGNEPEYLHEPSIPGECHPPVPQGKLKGGEPDD